MSSAHPGKYEALFARCTRFYRGAVGDFQAPRPARLRGGLGTGFCRCGSPTSPIRNYRDAARYANHDFFRRWWEGMLERDVLFHPGAFENLFVSFAHSDADIDRTLRRPTHVAALLRAHV